MEKISQSEQLRAVADPEILILFEDWLEELENETVAISKRLGLLTPKDLAKELGLSESGSMFIIAKLKREGKV